MNDRYGRMERARRKLRWKTSVVLLSIVVVFATMASLSSVARALVKKPLCGMEEHVHGEECYEVVKGALQCPFENATHVHDENCYEEQFVLTCNEDHEHEVSCFQTEQILVCTREECVIAHQHDETCYRQGELVCPLEEREEGDISHQHDDKCRGNDIYRLICDIPEHSHEDTCYISEEMETKRLYASSKEGEAVVWLLGKTKSIHLQETKEEDRFAIEEPYVYAKYIDITADEEVDEADIELKLTEFEVKDPGMVKLYRGGEVPKELPFVVNKNGYIEFESEEGVGRFGVFYVMPQDTALATVDFKDWGSQDKDIAMTLDDIVNGLVDVPVEVDGDVAGMAMGEVVGIGGDIACEDGGVLIGSNGFVHLKSEEKSYLLRVVNFTRLVDHVESDNVVIDVIDGGLPETVEPMAQMVDDATLQSIVETLGDTGEETTVYRMNEEGQAQEVVTKTMYAAYDINMMDGEEKYTQEGNYQVSLATGINPCEIVPGSAVATDVAYDVFRMQGDELEPLDAQGEEGNVVFATSSMDRFVIRFTVEFTYGANMHVLEGEGEILLSALLDSLGNPQDLTDSRLVFTNPELIALRPVVGMDGVICDWSLTSLMPFDTEELLTLTLADGQIVALKVTDSMVNILHDSIAISLIGGATNDGNHYVWHTNGEFGAGHTFTYRIEYTFSTDTQAKQHWEPGQMEIHLPKSILIDRNGEFSDTYTVSEAPDSLENLTDMNKLVFREEGDEIVLYNRLPIDPTQAGYIEVNYATSKETFSYRDYLSPTGSYVSAPAYARLVVYDEMVVDGNIVVDKDHVLANQESERIPVGIDTSAEVVRVDKQAPARYESWQASWGAEPADAGDYFYLVWPIKVTLKANQPFTYGLEDIFTPENGEVVGYRLLEHPSYAGMTGDLPFISASDGGNVMTLASIPLGEQERTEYVLTRLQKQYYNDLKERDGSFLVVNQVRAWVRPDDMVDAETVVSDHEPYTEKKPVYTGPALYFTRDKVGLTTNYQLTQFMQNQSLATSISEISGLMYSMYVDGNAFRYTYLYAGDENGNPDPLLEENNTYYGSPDKKVTFSLTDNELWLEYFDYAAFEEDPTQGDYNKKSERLTKDDYRFDSVTLDYLFRDGSYSTADKAFVRGPLLNDDQIAALAAGDNPRIGDIVMTVESPYEGASNIVIRYHFYDGTFDIENDTFGLVSSVDDKTVYFAKDANVTGITLRNDNAMYASRIRALASVTLKRNPQNENDPLEAVLPRINPAAPEIELGNRGDFYVTQEENTLFHSTWDGYDTLLGDTRESQIIKRYSTRKNDIANKRYLVTWTVDMEEDFSLRGETSLIRQNGGKFIDLLPEGTEYLMDTLVVEADGEVLNAGRYAVNVTPNYNESGRTLLEVDINKPADHYHLSYGTSMDWDVIVEQRDENMMVQGHNMVAYVTGNDTISTLENNAYRSGAFDAGDEDIWNMVTAQNNSDSGRRVIGTTYDCPLTALVSGTLGLSKLVRGADGPYLKSTYTYASDLYSYRISFGPSTGSIAKDLVVYDILEGYAESQWLGSFRSIDDSLAKSMGIAPVTYYSTIERDTLTNNRETMFMLDGEIEGQRIWLKAEDYVGSLDDVTAIAVDFSKRTDGQDFVLEGGELITLTVYLESPPHAVSQDNGEGEMVVIPDAVSTNEVYLGQKLTTAGDDAFTHASEDVIVQGHTYIHYRISGDLALRKIDESSQEGIGDVSFRLRGTSAYDAVVDMNVTTDNDGYAVFRDVELSQAGKPYELYEQSTSIDYQLDTTVYYVEVGTDGVARITGVKEGNPRSSVVTYVGEEGRDIVAAYDGYEGGPLSATATPGTYLMSNASRIHGDFTFMKYGLVDGEGERPLADAMFLLKGYSDYGNLVEKVVTSLGDGKITFIDVEKGEYDLIELMAPEGYMASNRTYRLKCDGDGVFTMSEVPQDTPSNTNFVAIDYTAGILEYALYDEPYHDFGLYKVDAKSDAILPGATFSLKGISDYGNVVDTSATSQANGSIFFHGLEAGTYVLKETVAPVAAMGDNNEMHYVQDETNYIVTIGRDGLVTVKWTGTDNKDYEITNNITFKENDVEVQRIVTTDGLGDVPDSSKVGERIFIPRYGLFKMPNERAEEGTLTVVKVWQDSDGNELVDTGNNPIPTVLVDTEVPKETAGKAMICRTLFDRFIAGPNPWHLKNRTQLLRFVHWDGDPPFPSGTPFVNNDSALRRIEYDGRVWVCVSMSRSDEFNDDVPPELLSQYQEMFPGDVWFCNDNGTVYWYSNSQDVYLPYNCKGLFQGCYNATTIDLRGIRADYVTDMSYMFAYNGSVDNSGQMALTSLLLPNNFNTTNVTNMFYMFNKCRHLVSLNLKGFDTRNVAKLGAMFCYCEELVDFDFSHFDTSAATDLSWMFVGMRSVESFDLSNFVTDKVTTMSYMFRNCPNLKWIDLSSFVTRSGVNMTSMFEQQNGSSLKTIYVSDRWNKNVVGGHGGMFNGCTTIVGGNGTTFNSSFTNKAYANIDQDGQPGYLTYKEAPPAPSFVQITYDDPSGDDETKPVYKTSVSSMVPVANVMVDNDGAYVMMEGEKQYIYDKWLYDQASGRWYYNFHVWRTPIEYDVWEQITPDSLMDNWVWTDPQDPDGGNQWYTAVNYEIDGSDNKMTITNRKKTTVSTTGDLLITKVLDDPSVAGREFDFVVTINGRDYPTTIKPGECRLYTGYAAGTSFTVKEILPNDYNAPEPCLDSSSDGTKTTYTVAQGNIAAGTQTRVVVENSLKQNKGSLVIHKQSEYADGVTDFWEHGEFTFTIRLWVEEDTPVIGLHGGLYFDANGETTVVLQGRGINDTITLDNLPEGIKYRVFETPVDYFQTTIKKNDEEAVEGTTIEGVIQAGITDRLDFKNVKTQDNPVGGFSLEKQMGSYSADPDTPFTFYLSLEKLTYGRVFSYQIHRKDGTVETQSFTPNTDGHVYLDIRLKATEWVDFSGPVSGLEPGSYYTIIEDACDYVSSYVASEENTGTLAQGKGANTVIRKTMSTAREMVEKDELARFVFANTEKQYALRIMKIDNSSMQGLAGALLTVNKVVLEDGVEVLRQIDAFTTTKAAKEIALPHGTYVIHESIAPDGYAKADDIRFRLDIDGMVTLLTYNEENGAWEDSGQSGMAQDMTLEMHDVPYVVNILKQDKDGKGIAGAYMKILQDGSVVEQWISDVTGVHAVSGKLKLDTEYVLQEATAPIGYAKAEDIHFMITQKGEEIYLVKGVWDETSQTYVFGTDGETNLQLVMVDDTEFVFYKMWRDMHGVQPQTWREPIHLTFSRRYEEEGLMKPDKSFSLDFTVNITPETKVGDVFTSDGYALQYTGAVIDRNGMENHAFALRGLPKYVDNVEYTYYVNEETAEHSQPAKYYFNGVLLETDKVESGGVIANDEASYVLPESGGHGTGRLYTLGGLFIVMALLMGMRNGWK